MRDPKHISYIKYPQEVKKEVDKLKVKDFAYEVNQLSCHLEKFKL